MRTWARVWVLACCVLLAAPAWAQREPSESDRATARALMDRGDKAVEEGKLEAALKAYKAADDIMRVPTTGLELGRTQIKLGHLVEASNTLVRVQRYPRKSDEPGAFSQAREEARQLAAGLPKRIPSATIEIQGLAASDKALVRLDGQPVPAATLGLPRQVNPGDHVLTANARGYKPAETRFSIAESETKTVTLALSVESGEEPIAAPPPGAPAEEKSTTTISPLTWIGLSLGVAGIAVGTATGVVALGRGSDLQDKCADGDPNICDPDYQEDIDNATLIAHVSTASFAVGGAALVVGIVSLAIDLTRKGSDSSVGPRELVVGAGSIGVRGRFF